MLLVCKNASSTAIPSRKLTRANIIDSSANLRQEIISILSSSKTPASICLDGWTNVNGNKVTNIVLLSQSRAWYWMSIVNDDQSNTAKYIHEKLKPILEDLVKKDIKFIGLVADTSDNEAANKVLFKMLTTDFPFMIHIPRSAHTIQLAVNGILDKPIFKDIMSTITSIINSYANNKANRLKVCSLCQSTI
jgi:hypothetical protein